MIEVRISGGIGNQLFQYAFGYAMARKYNQMLVLDRSYFEYDKSREYNLDKFHLCPNEAITYMENVEPDGFVRYIKILGGIYNKKRKLRKYIVIQEGESFCDIHETDNYYFRGFWQNEKYFKQYREEIICQFIPVWKVSSEYERWLNLIQQNKSASVHVRRTDYTKYNAVIHPEYYLKAIKKLLLTTDVDMLYIFTDDSKWVDQYFGKKEIKIPYKIVSGNGKLTDIEELMLMKACSHHIIANSSFSWWGAWLGDCEEKVVIAPKVNMWNEKFYCSDWTLLDAELWTAETKKQKNEAEKSSFVQNLRNKLLAHVKEAGYL